MARPTGSGATVGAETAPWRTTEVPARASQSLLGIVKQNGAENVLITGQMSSSRATQPPDNKEPSRPSQTVSIVTENGPLFGNWSKLMTAKYSRTLLNNILTLHLPPLNVSLIRWWLLQPTVKNLRWTNLPRDSASRGTVRAFVRARLCVRVHAHVRARVRAFVRVRLRV